MTDSPQAESTSSRPAALRSDIQQIISQGQKQERERRGSLKAVVALTAASLLLLWRSFTPVEFAPAAWIALVPLLLLGKVDTLPRGSYRVLAGLGFLWAGITLQWMRLGHVSMYGALFAMALYVGLYIPVFVLLVRRVRSAVPQLPLWLSAPVIWVALEYLRAYLFTGFSWYYLGHSQYRWQALIQIADVTGVYGISFLIAMSSAVIADLIPRERLRKLGLDVADENVPASTDATNSQPEFSTGNRPGWSGPVCLVALVGLTCIYGMVRRLPDDQFGKGPVIALLQGNFSPEVKHDDTTAMERYRTHMMLQQQAAAEQPDLIVWPETMFPDLMVQVAEGITDDQILDVISAQGPISQDVDAEYIIKRWRDDIVERSLRDMTQAHGCAIMVGIPAQTVKLNAIESFNSAVFVRPDTGIAGRYDKIHRVLFGEYIPLKDIFPFLQNLTPYGAGFGLTAGDGFRMFEYNGFRFSPLICYEDTVPQLVRQQVQQQDADGQAPDVLVNLTNDAWFRGSSELDQHLITAAFRCIETRTPMVRAVNGGISAFIDGNGQIREPDRIAEMDVSDRLTVNADLTDLQGMRDPATGRWRRQFTGLIVGQLPTDPRASLYVKFGDCFAIVCSLLTIVGMMWSVAARRRQ
ncbi:MAG: apolipoprotein N-acyltransferase [Planctomycetaceae bacterium]|nr:apolipoprotein N-acyltransferase [Planctomycetaceae bacterium]